MNIYFRAKDLNIPSESKQMMANRLFGLNKFFSYDTNAYVDVEQTHQSHHGHDLFYVSIKIDDPHNQYFTEEYRENIRSAFDHAYGDMFRVVRSHRSKSRNLARKAGQKIKRLFRKNKY
ncbi:MAG: HPF/RaiA family ribosome-associated protein [Candidatus Pacebacteria bacterium]|nr:HPF/RaiA family ribosome-associated protein [Candidatus Paceibacterota bacterium]